MPRRDDSVDWSKPMEPGPVRFPTRDEALADSRRLEWFDAHVLPFPLDRIIIVAKPRENKRGWFIARVKWDGTAWADPDARDVRYSAASVTHWHEDTLGTPLA